MSKRKIIIDCDPGVDDALAISAIFNDSNLEVLGICCVEGNSPLKYTYKNALKPVDYFNYSTFVYKGEKSLDNKKMESSSFHGKCGFGDCKLKYTTSHLSSTKAVDFLIETIEKYPNEIEIVALGPLSNLARLIKKSPASFSKIKSIYSMGGSYGIGNVTSYCEFNYYFDLVALEIVNNALEENLNVSFHMFPLNITNKVAFDMNELYFLRQEADQWGKHIWDMFFNNYAYASYMETGKSECVLHDLVVAMYVVEPLLYDIKEKESFLISKDGETYGKMIKCNGSASIYVHFDVDSFSMKKKYLELIYGQQLASKYEQFVLEMKK